MHIFDQSNVYANAGTFSPNDCAYRSLKVYREKEKKKVFFSFLFITNLFFIVIQEWAGSGEGGSTPSFHWLQVGVQCVECSLLPPMSTWAHGKQKNVRRISSWPNIEQNIRASFSISGRSNTEFYLYIIISELKIWKLNDWRNFYISYIIWCLRKQLWN